ncbi:DNA polymerase III, beta subunit [Bacteroidales bacterium KA00251]|nr:DNA polymerase III, beta subunit [Bacteroidales bacterium KA00251]
MISFSVNSGELATMLQSIARVVPTQDPNRLRTELLFEIEGKRLRITGSNPQYKISGVVELTEEATGNCCFTIPPSDIVDYVKDVSDQGLRFDYEPDNDLGRGPLKMSFQGGEIRFTATDGENYPAFEKEENSETKQFTLQCNLISEALDAVLPSASQDSSRRALSGVCFRFFPQSLDIVTTDSVILSRYTISGSFLSGSEDGDKKSFILPPNCASFLKGYLPRYNEEDLEISFTEKSILFKVREVEIESLLIDANYPNYVSIIPTECEYSLTMKTFNLRSVIKRMVKFIPDDGIISLKANGNELLLQTEKNEENKFAEEVIKGIENPNGLALTIYFDKKRLMTTIDNINTEDILFKIIDNTRPVLIAPAMPSSQEEGVEKKEKSEESKAKRGDLLNLISVFAPSAQ